MHQPYVAFLFALGLVVVIALTMLVGSHFAGPRKPTEAKGQPYESGMPPLGTARQRFSVKFYLVAMLFIVFDIETVFMWPWAAIYFGGPSGGPGMGFLLVEMVVFIGILAAGLVYVWKRGALEWD